MSFLMADVFDSTTTEIISRHRMLENVNIRGIRPEIYKHGSFSGTSITLDVYNGSNLLGTKTLTADEINTGITGTYSHGYLFFEFDDSIYVDLDESTDYSEIEIRIRCNGYTFSESNYFSILKRFDNPIVDEYPNSIVTAEFGGDGHLMTTDEGKASTRPYSIEIYEVNNMIPYDKDLKY